MSVSIRHPCFAQAELGEYTVFCLLAVPELPASYYTSSFTEMYFFFFFFILLFLD